MNKYSGSKSMGIQMIHLNIRSRLETIHELKRVYNAKDNDPTILKLQKEIKAYEEEYKVMESLVVDNINIFH